MTEEAHRVIIFERRLINASVEWLGPLITFYDTDGMPWIDNILVPELLWEDRGNDKTWALENQSRARFVGRSVSWRGTVSFRPDYLTRSPVNTRAIARRICDVCLR